MRLLKPPPGTCLDRAHPLARGLVGCWLLNEGAGTKAHDGAGAQTLVDNSTPTWGPDRCDFNGVDQAFFGDVAIDLEKDFTVVTTVCTGPVSSEHIAVGIGDPTYGCRFVLGVYSTGRYRCLFREDDNTNVANVYALGDEIDDGRPHQLAFCFAPSADTFHCLLDGAVLGSSTPSAYTGIHAEKVSIGSAYWQGSLTNHWPGSIYHVYLYRRALTPDEIAQLYCEPYAIFIRPVASVAAVASLAAGPVHDLAGSIAAGAACSAMAGVVRRLTGVSAASSQASASLSQTSVVALSATVQASSSLAGSLQISPAPSQLRAAWWGDALFNGMTAQALKLGTTLTQGWFWMRRTGCSAVYRGPSIDEVDFDDIVCVTDPQAGPVVLPTHLPHEPGSSHCYVVRRFNGCGHQELTATAIVAVTIGPDGRRAAPGPNRVFGLTARRTGGNRIQLRWFYCPLRQETAPQMFKIYTDNGTGQLDLDTALATISYEGRRHYDLQTGPLTEGQHTFAIRAESAAGVASVTMATVSCSIEAHDPEAATILAGEAIP